MKKLIARCWFVMLLALMPANTVLSQRAPQAQTYYVALGGANANAGSITQPWATVEYAGQTAKPGDTILVRGGTYAEGEVWLRAEFGHCGKAGQFVTIAAYPNETPIFTNGQRPFIIDCDYLRVQGLHFRNGKSIGIANNNHVQVVGNSFKGDGYGYDAISSEGSDILIEGNVCDINGNSVGTQGHCYYIHQGTNIVVRGNTARGMTGYGIHVFDQRRSEDPPNYERLIKDIVIEGNVCYESKERSGIIVAAYDHARIENILIRNNIAYANALSGIVVRSQVKNAQVYNNTLVDNGAEPIEISGDDPIEDLSIRNNIIDIADHGDIFYIRNYKVAVSTTLILNTNLYWPGPPKLQNISEQRVLAGDPRFIARASRNYHLGEDSPAIDAGVVLTQVMDDIDRQSRPQGSGMDVGADEFFTLTLNLRLYLPLAIRS
jgi:Right handed beta helix region/Chondroitinase B